MAFNATLNIISVGGGGGGGGVAFLASILYKILTKPLGTFHITIVSGERGMNPVAMNFIISQIEIEQVMDQANDLLIILKSSIQPTLLLELSP